MHLLRNIEARSLSHCCRRKAIGIAYSECVSVALVIHHAMHIWKTVICGLSGSTIIFHIILQTARFSEKGFEYKICV
jgi:hypothetical protein